MTKSCLASSTDLAPATKAQSANSCTQAPQRKSQKFVNVSIQLTALSINLMLFKTIFKGTVGTERTVL